MNRPTPDEINETLQGINDEISGVVGVEKNSLHRESAQRIVARLAKLERTFKERDAKYGPSYLQAGKVLFALLGPIHLEDEADLARFGVLNMIVSKLTRYGNNFLLGGHDDSLKDLSIYANILRELDYQDGVKKMEAAFPPMEKGNE